MAAGTPSGYPVTRIRGSSGDWGVVGVGVPLGVEEVVAGDALVEFAGFLRFHHLDELGGSAGPHFVGADFGLGEDHGAGCHQGAFSDFHVIHDDGAHSDKGELADMAAVEGDVMADGDVVADFDGGFLVEGVEYRPVLVSLAFASSFRRSKRTSPTFAGDPMLKRSPTSE